MRKVIKKEISLYEFIKSIGLIHEEKIIYYTKKSRKIRRRRFK